MNIIYKKPLLWRRITIFTSNKEQLHAKPEHLLAEKMEKGKNGALRGRMQKENELLHCVIVWKFKGGGGWRLFWTDWN